jgi:hypothetical protein
VAQSKNRQKAVLILESWSNNIDIVSSEIILKYGSVIQVKQGIRR